MRMTLQNRRDEERLRQAVEPVLPIPLLVELEGGLIATDMRLERLAATLSAGRFAAAWGILAGRPGNDGLDMAAQSVPCRDETLIVMENAHRSGRPVLLVCSDAMRPLALLLQARLGTISGLIGAEALRADRETALEAAGQSGPFDYVGQAGTESVCWSGARQSYSVETTREHGRAFDRQGLDVTALSGKRPRGKAMLKLLRPHQYAKNMLVFVPMLTSHQLNAGALLSAFIAFLCFSLAASAVYVINDFVDLHADRVHPSKRRRPFAAGTVPLGTGLALVPLLLGGAALLAAQLPLLFSILLVGYMALTTAYSFVLKKMLLVDVTVLSLLYSLRVVAGAAAVSVAVSEWLFAFSLMFFTALALTKRYVELADRLDRELPDPSNRDYRIADLPIIAALAAAAGMNAITVLALYVNSDTVKGLYARPAVLWLLCPLFLYWIGRVLLLAHRRQLHDDPIVFALTDVRSWFVGAATLTIVSLAM